MLSRVFVDSRWFTVEQVGDLTQPIGNGTMAQHIAGALESLA